MYTSDVTVVSHCDSVSGAQQVVNQSLKQQSPHLSTSDTDTAITDSGNLWLHIRMRRTIGKSYIKSYIKVMALRRDRTPDLSHVDTSLYPLHQPAILCLF